MLNQYKFLLESGEIATIYAEFLSEAETICEDEYQMSIDILLDEYKLA